LLLLLSEASLDSQFTYWKPDALGGVYSIFIKLAYRHQPAE